MSKVFFAASMAAYTNAKGPSTRVVYPGDRVDDIKIDPALYPMVFKWPE